MKMQSLLSRLLCGFALCAWMPFACNTARASGTVAATWWWDGATDPASATGESLDTTTNGESWFSDGYWDNGSVVETLSSWSDGDSAIFGGTAASQTITVGTLTIGNLTFGQGPQGAGAAGTAYTLSGGTLTLSGTTAITNNTDTTISSLLAGSGSLSQWGPATLTLTAQNTYTGGTTINNGTLATIDFATVGTGTINIGSNGTYVLTTYGYNQPTFANAVSGSGSFKANGSPDNQSFWSGDWSGFTGTLTIGSGDTGWWADAANIGSPNMRIQMLGTGAPYGSFLGLYAFETGLTCAYNIGELTGGAECWVFGQPDTGNNITLSVGALGTSTTYAGVICNNWRAYDDTSTMNLTKVGAGTLTLTGANTYTGATTISDGTLQVDGAIGTGGVTVQSGGTLGGAGIIAGPVTVNGGGTLTAGDPSGPGVLTIANALTLNSGSTTTLRLNPASGTHDSVSGVTTLTYGGTLTVANLGGTLAAGNSFQLLNATTFVGNFAATNLPALASGLAWNWTPSNGTLIVVAPPAITDCCQLPDNSFSLNFTGTLGASFTVHATTNLASPISSWTVVTNGLFNGSPVSYQDTNATNYPARFYQVTLP